MTEPDCLAELWRKAAKRPEPLFVFPPAATSRTGRPVLWQVLHAAGPAFWRPHSGCVKRADAADAIPPGDQVGATTPASDTQWPPLTWSVEFLETWPGWP